MCQAEHAGIPGQRTASPHLGFRCCGHRPRPCQLLLAVKGCALQACHGPPQLLQHRGGAALVPRGLLWRHCFEGVAARRVTTGYGVELRDQCDQAKGAASEG